MSKNIFQVYTANPITSNAATDLMYFGRSPYGVGDDAGMTFADFASQFGNPYTPSALTKVDDTNITLTLGGTPSTALLQTVSLTAGWTGLLSPARGGTGVNNGSSTLTLGGNTAFSGAFTFTGTLTGNTSVTFPTSGTLATTSQIPTVTPSALTKTDDTNVTLTLGGTPGTALLQTVSLTLGWTGLLSPSRGGTGVNNGTSTLTLGGNHTLSGAFASTFTFTNTTTVTFPTSGTLATTSQIPTGAALTKTDDTNVTLTLGGSASTALVNAASLTLGWTGQLGVTRGGTGLASTTVNQILYSSATSVIAGLATANNGILVTSAAGVPSIGNTVGAGLTMPSITFSSTTGVVGTTTNNSAAAGSVGEYVSSNVANASATSISNATPTNLTSISLTAGDWNVGGNIFLNGSGAVLTTIKTGISTTSATFPDASSTTIINSTTMAASNLGFNAPIARISISGTTTVYIVAQANFASGSCTQSGNIWARRIR